MKALFLFLIIFSTPPETINEDDILEVTEEVTKKIESIESYQFVLIKRELVDGRDTGYQYANVKVNVDPLQIYLKFTKPKDVAGREALYKDGELTVKRGGTRMSNLVLHLKPDSPLAMVDNRYDITYINPKKLSDILVTKIKNEIQFEDTELYRCEDAKVFGQSGMHYRLIHPIKKEGMTCYAAEVFVSDTLGLPIYFRVVNFNNKVIEEYAFNHMEINVKFEDNEFKEDNLEYRFRQD